MSRASLSHRSGGTRALIVFLVTLLLSACGQQPKTSATPSRTPSATVTPQPLTSPGPLKFSMQAVAQGLEAPWAVDFAKDGTIWLTERPGRVRIVRGGQLLPGSALTLNVATSPGCEGGLLGFALQEPSAYLYYTYLGSSGNTNRVSRFTIHGDQLVDEHVLLDGIIGGTCYHDGGRIRFGPDGLLYITTGEGYVPSRSADPNNLSGKILRMRPDGSGRESFAWGFRNPQGIAFDAKGRLYASNHGPSGDLGLCCHDEIDYVEQGHYYGWPAWAANVRTSYPQGGLPDRTRPIAESGTDTWAPSGITFYAPSKREWPTLLVAELRGKELRRFIIDPNDPSKLIGQEVVLNGQGRLRDAVAGPDGCLYVLTSNRDSRGTPGPGDDRLLKLCPA